jgi:hypothetical protein
MPHKHTVIQLPHWLTFVLFASFVFLHLPFPFLCLWQRSSLSEQSCYFQIALLLSLMAVGKPLRMVVVLFRRQSLLPSLLALDFLGSLPIGH